MQTVWRDIGLAVLQAISAAVGGVLLFLLIRGLYRLPKLRQNGKESAEKWVAEFRATLSQHGTRIASHQEDVAALQHKVRSMEEAAELQGNAIQDMRVRLDALRRHVVRLEEGC